MTSGEGASGAEGTAISASGAEDTTGFDSGEVTSGAMDTGGSTSGAEVAEAQGSTSGAVGGVEGSDSFAGSASGSETLTDSLCPSVKLFVFKFSSLYFGYLLLFGHIVWKYFLSFCRFFHCIDGFLCYVKSFSV